MANTKLNIDRQTLAAVFKDPQAVRAMESLLLAASNMVSPGDVAITGGTIDGTVIGGNTPEEGTFTALHTGTLSVTSTAEVANLRAARATVADLLSGINDIAHGGTGLSTAPANGQLLVGNGTGFNLSTITAGANITITNGAGSITISAGGSAALPRNYISGFGLANDTTTPNTVLAVAAGQASDSTNTATVTGAAFRKSISGSWTAGTGNNGMGVGLTAANNTWYHVFGIVVAGAYDVYFDTSIAGANKPAGTTAFRYIGSIKTNSSAQIIGFTQSGQYFYWKAQVLDYSGPSSVSPVLQTLSTPLGVNCIANITITCILANAYVWSPLSGAALPTEILRVNSSVGVGSVPSTGFATNTLSQVYHSISTTSGTLYLFTTGYINPLVAQN